MGWYEEENAVNTLLTSIITGVKFQSCVNYTGEDWLEYLYASYTVNIKEDIMLLNGVLRSAVFGWPTYSLWCDFSMLALLSLEVAVHQFW